MVWKSRFTSLILFLLVICSCNKEDTDIFISPLDNADTTWVENSTTGVKSDFQHLLDTLLSPPAEIFIQEIQKNQSFPAGKDLIINLPSGSFLDPSGNITAGAATVSVIYLKTRGEMLKNRISGTVNDQVVKPLFAIRLSIRQNGRELMLAPGKKLEIFFEKENPEPGYQLFIVGPGSGLTNWIANPDGDISIVSNNSRMGYKITTGQMQWLIPGQIITPDKPTTITASLPNIYTNANSKLYILINDRNGLAEMNPDKNQKSFFARNMPEGIPTRLISVSSIKGTYYLGMEEVEIKNKLHIKIKPKAVSYSELTAFLNSLQ